MQATDRNQTYLLDALNVVLRRVWYVLLCLIGVLAPVIYYNQTATPIYEAYTTIIFEKTPSPMPSYNSSEDLNRKGFLSNQIEEIKSRSVSAEVVSQLSPKILASVPLPELMPENFDKEKYYAAIIRESISAVPVRESDILKISVRMPDRFASASIANMVASVLRDRSMNIRKEEVSGMRGFIEDQMSRYQRELLQAEERLKAFKESKRIVDLDQQSQEILRRSTQAEILWNEAKTRLEAAQQRLNFIKGKILERRKDLVPAITDVTNPWVDKLKNKLTDLQVEYTNFQVQGYSQDHPHMKKLSEEIAATQLSLSEEALKIAEAQNVMDPISQIKDYYKEQVALEIELQSLAVQEKALRTVINDYENTLKSLPEQEFELARLSRAAEVSNKVVLMLHEKREEAKISEAERLGNIRIIDQAEVPKLPVTPRKTLNLFIGLILGMTMGLGLAFFMDSLDTALKTPEEVERKIGIPIVGSIPRIRVNANPPGNGKSQAPIDEMMVNRGHPPARLITHLQPSSPVAEAYRTLRTNLQFADPQNPLRCVMLTSSGPREGKSTTAANLAVATAQMGLHTLVIDGDLRKPMQHRIFETHREPGLADILTMHFELFKHKLGKEKLENIYLDGDGNGGTRRAEQNNLSISRPKGQINPAALIKSPLELSIMEVVQSTKIKNLDIIASGFLPHNPSEILASNAMTELIAFLKQKYEFIVIDAPPTIAVTDAAVIGPKVDGTVIVVESGRNDKEIIFKARNMLERVGVRLVGIILNNIMEKNLYGDYNYYYTYYAQQPVRKS